MKSMTGFGRAQSALEDGTLVTVTVRSVNHRFLDLSLKLRDDLAPLESQLRKLVQDSVTRGHVDLTVRLERPPGRTAAFDEDALSRYASLWRALARERDLPADLTARDLLSLPGAVRTSEEADTAGASVTEAVLAAVRTALAAHDETRRREGAALAEVLGTILGRLEAGLARLDEARQGLSDRLLASLKERVAALAAGVPLDEARLAAEVALLADRADISEEVDRFRAHLVEARSLCRGDGAIGKRLDFLVQELHREANTSGSKARELGAVRLVLDLKADVEALREQVQNVE